jgi:predicted metalloprotease
MRWTNSRRSGNIEDRRGMGPAGVVGGGIGAVVIALLYMLLGGDPENLPQTAQPEGGAPPEQTDPNAPPDQEKAFVNDVLGSTNNAWNEVFQASGSRYREPTLVLFTGATGSGCGHAQSAVGPFYCPADQKVYIDLGFYQELRDRFQAPGDFAQAYVIAHEVGHHVQNLTGVSDQVQQASARASRAEGNALSVRLELQADCYAGVWAHQARGKDFDFEPGDVEEALAAASAIGDDRLQQEAQGRVVPESFTHGTSEQRVRWFRRGLDTGDVNQCDTFTRSL